MLTLLLLAAPAHAWEHIGTAWYQEQFPLIWYMTPPEEESLPEGEALALLKDSWDKWEDDAPCSGVSNTYGSSSSNAERNREDGKITMHFNDPSGEIEAGVIAVTYSSWGTEIVKETSSKIYRNLLDADIVFNDNIDFGTPEDMLSGCSNQMTYVGTATHEIGHLYGLAHSCEQGDACPETDKQEATMFWSGGDCDPMTEDLNVDDIASITALYGASASFVATTERIGATPLDVTFEVSADADITGADWNFGDGETSTEINPTHTYTRAGQYTVQAEVALDDEVCGGSVFTYDELGYVLVCDIPTPTEGAGGYFSMLHDDGLTWATTNHTDVSVYGCVDFISWEVYAGSGISGEPIDLDGDGDSDVIGAWSPKIRFPAEGTYTVVMNVGGPGGTKAGMMTVDVVDVATDGSSCSTSGADLGLGALALAGLVGLRRRRS